MLTGKRLRQYLAYAARRDAPTTTVLKFTHGNGAREVAHPGKVEPEEVRAISLTPAQPAGADEIRAPRAPSSNRPTLADLFCIAFVVLILWLGFVFGWRP